MCIPGLLALVLVLLLEASASAAVPRSVREVLMRSAARASLSIAAGAALVAVRAHAAEDAQTSPLRGFQTKSGLKYFDMMEGTGESPRYGDLVSFHYTSYYKPAPESTLDFIDSSYMSGKRPFLHKHGNGRVIRGIDEALHTMRVGGKRRIIVPRSIGYNEFGLGPLPEDGGRRRKLGSLLDLLDKDQGELVFDLELVLVAEDENDQSYYDDLAMSQEELRSLVLKSLNANTPEFFETLKRETPKSLFKK